MGLRKALAHVVMRVSRWTFTPGHPLPERCVVLGAPHTSNWDGFYMVVAMWALKRPFYFLVKKNLTDVPVIGRIVQAIGGIPVDRENPGHLVEQVIALAQSSETFVLVIAPKGTRSIRPYWKSGFYRIAQGANLPVVPGFIDGGQRRYGWGAPIELRGDQSKDTAAPRAGFRAGAATRWCARGRSTRRRWHCNKSTRPASTSTMPYKPTARCSPMTGADFWLNTTFWWASPSMAPKRCTIATASRGRGAAPGGK